MSTERITVTITADTSRFDEQMALARESINRQIEVIARLYAHARLCMHFEAIDQDDA